MKLGYSYRLAQYAFGLGLLGLVLASVVVFSLNLVSLRAERYQSKLTTRLTRASTSQDEAGATETEQPGAGDEQGDQASPATTPSAPEFEDQAPARPPLPPAPKESEPRPEKEKKAGSEPDLTRLALVQTLKMMKPMAFYLVLTGAAFAILRGFRKTPPAHEYPPGASSLYETET